MLCQEEMERDLPGEVVPVVEEVSVEEEGVVAGWEEQGLGRDPAGIVSAPVAEQRFLIRWGHPAIVLTVPVAVQRW